eukprot:CAMPEP_0119126574 /NCGR_PEP_ID=MMETSP1310-20130426/5453_1 /TAXON_ID=464262 /ORGANISM="Genus nov. species nov., Strain RCC2339" /LENGTH=346 /DNA_ID=CAMNT_0007116743 /DNA_START=1 /DNA_END=1038 /DNA_ORIENTATION=-
MDRVLGGKLTQLLNDNTPWICRPCLAARSHALRNVIAVLKKMDEQRYFWHPVKDRDAPGYSSIVKHPMAFDNIDNRCKSDEYKRLVDFVGDIELVFQNAHAYNGAGSDVAKDARRLEAEARDLTRGLGSWFAEATTEKSRKTVKSARSSEGGKEDEGDGMHGDDSVRDRSTIPMEVDTPRSGGAKRSAKRRASPAADNTASESSEVEEEEEEEDSAESSRGTTHQSTAAIRALVGMNLGQGPSSFSNLAVAQGELIALRKLCAEQAMTLEMERNHSHHLRRRIARLQKDSDHWQERYLQVQDMVNRQEDLFFKFCTTAGSRTFRSDPAVRDALPPPPSDSPVVREA